MISGALVGLMLAAAPVRVLVSIGNDVGDPADAPLAWATEDAQRFLQLFVDIGGVSAPRAQLVAGQNATVVREKLSEAAGHVNELAAQGEDVMFIVYVSAHASAGALHLNGTRLELAEVRERIAATSARLKLLVIDACDSGTVTQRKGLKAAPAYQVSILPEPVRGEIVITSSGPAESSQEWASLEGSLFTHHLLTGLRGDADVDQDGAVSLNEAYAYTFRRTVVNAAREGQHPTFDLDIAGAGEVQLSQPQRARSAVLFPAPLEGNWVLASQPKPYVVAEVEKVAGRPLRLAVPPGRYVLRKRMGEKVGLVTFELPFGGERVVDESELQVKHFAEVAVKGGFIELRPWSFTLGAGAESEQIDGFGARGRVWLGGRRTVGIWWLQANAGFSWARNVKSPIATVETQFLGRASGGYRYLAWPVIPYVGPVVEGRLFVQQYGYDRPEAFAAIDAKPAAPNLAVGFSFGLLAGVEVPFGDRWFVVGELDGLLGWLKVKPSGTTAIPVPAAALLFGGRLAVGVRF